MSRAFIIIAAVLGFLGVALGAFGAHTLTATFAANGREETFRTAVHYQMIHALALLAVAWRAEKQALRLLRWAGFLFTAGVLLFSGSLYLLSIFDLSFMGAVAPMGGASLLGGWVLFGLAAWRQDR